MNINENGRALTAIVLSVLSLIGMTLLVVLYSWLPEARSTLAASIDDAFYFVVWTSTVLTVGVVAYMLYLMMKFRRRSNEERTEGVPPNHTLELAWIVLPTILVLVVFTWGFRSFVSINVAPPNTYDIYVTAQKWFWQFQYPNGVTTSNEFVVPVDRPVKLIMTSQDVLHSFFIPEFRVKHDVVPNRYTTVWFQATEETAPAAVEGEQGDFIQVFCTEYCGTNHSKMGAELRVLSLADFDNWLATGGGRGDMEPLELGQYLYTNQACVGCHSTDGSQVIGPTFQGLYGQTNHTLADGTTVTVDEEYLRESILQSQAKVAAGFQPVMPSYANLSNEEVTGLIEFIKSLQ